MCRGQEVEPIDTAFMEISPGRKGSKARKVEWKAKPGEPAK
jgi:hypothetical protein